MNAPIFNFGISLLLLALLSPRALTQNKVAPDNARDAFIYTRVKVSAGAGAGPARANRHRARRQYKAAVIGVGYTVYQRDTAGVPVRVSPAQEFRRGDAVRLIVESNIDGYLYIFHTENDGPPEMIFPDARLDGGRNGIAAHAPYEAPKRHWFIFNERAATERLYVVVAKAPLPGVPVGDGLLTYCAADKRACPWRPADESWSRIAGALTDAREDHNGAFGQSLTEVERKAIERGLGLGLDDPAPSVIRMGKSPQARQLVTLIALTHK
jgi:hypothetical protein